MRTTKYLIKDNKCIEENYYLLTIKDFPSSLPGQFVNILCQKDDSVMLRRPFCIHNVQAQYTSILYKVVGKGTKLLSNRKPGEYLDIIGPLGNGWILEDKDIQDYSCHILVGGGVGVAPLLPLAYKLSEKSCNISVIIGAKTKADLLCEDNFSEIRSKLHIVTDDGSYGEKGLVTDILKKIVNGSDNKKYYIYSCGSKLMLKAVALWAISKNIPCQVSMEEMMGCGLGGCLCCVVETTTGYKKVCNDGPVFMAKDIIW